MPALLRRFCLVVAALCPLGSAVAAAPLTAIGVAKVDVTPPGPVVLAGYGARKSEHEGVDSRLWARALVIGESEPAAIVVLDNCGVPSDLVAALAARLAPHGVSAERLIVAATHTHNAPNLKGYAPILWAGRTTPEQDAHVAEYTALALQRMEEAVVNALKARRPMQLERAQGRATFGGNRRVLNNGRWSGFGFQRSGPVDHSLPVLAARDSEGNVRAVWANYACHCTTVGSRNRIGGDWAGFANEALERRFPNAVSLVSIGCGADVGPQPSGSLELAQQHGQAVADEVGRLLAQPTVPLAGPPEVRSRRVALPFAAQQPREYWLERRKQGGFQQQLAQAMLTRIDDDGAVPAKVDYPITVWTFADDLAMVFLAGEVVVDYSVRLNRELDWSRLWITAWSDGMPGYIPSRRVLAEGGYEPEFSQVYYGQPGPYAPELEDALVAAVVGLLPPAFAARDDQSPAPFHRVPSGRNAAFQRAKTWAAAPNSDADAAILAELRTELPRARSAIQPGSLLGGERTEWHDFAGDFVTRRFVRQEESGSELSWRVPAAKPEGESAIICWTGGVGWQSQPSTTGFALLVDGVERLRFDVTREPTRWTSTDGKTVLTYLPTWTSNEDSGGFFILRSERAPSQLGVRSLGRGSQRWFAVDVEQPVESNLKRLDTALR